MSDATVQLERELLSCAYLEAEVIDQAAGAGITPAHFTAPQHAQQWRFICELRGAGKDTDTSSVCAAAMVAGLLDKLGGIAGITEASSAVATTMRAGATIDAILSLYAQRRVNHLFITATESISAGTATTESLRHIGEKVAELCAGHATIRRDTATIADEAIKDAEEAMAGTKPSRTLITTGLPTFDKYASPIEDHEYVVVGARTSHGKSSFLLQMAGNALHNNQRVAIFTLETSDKAVLKQMAAQRAGINLREFANEMPAKQAEYVDKLRHLRESKNLLIFDRDIRLSAIEARCRLLASTFRPHLVIVDYLGLVGVDGNGQYEKITQISKAAIPLRKKLGCALVLGCQLGRGSEKEDREPTRTDFRDSGSIEEDAHRIICLWRPSGQPLDLTYYESYIMQLKLRDGALCKVQCRFHAPTTKFIES